MITGRRFRLLTARRAAGVLLLLVSLAAACPAAAQVPDTSRTDTLRAPADTLRQDTLRTDSLAADTTVRPRRPAGPPLGFGPGLPGTSLGERPPARRTAALAATDRLADVPGTFLYDLGAVGWPHGWSVRGLRPARPALLLNGRAFDDLATGRPRYDLLPLELLEPLRTSGPLLTGRPATVVAELRPYDSRRPLTELRYHRANPGMQAVSALHTQRRRPRFLRSATLDVLGAYQGRAADNEYPGSRLSRERRLLGRLQYARPGWAVELSALHNRRRLGAQSGVRFSPGNPVAIYNRLRPDVRSANAERRLLRTDFALTGRARLLSVPFAPTTAAAYWTKQFSRYRRQPSDTLAVALHLDRYGGFFEQRLETGRHRLLLRLEGRADVPGAGTPDAAAARTRLHLTAHDSLHLGRFGAVVEAGLHSGSQQTYPTGRLALDADLGALQLFGAASVAGQPVSLVEQYGFGGYVQPLDERPTGRVQRARLGAALRGGPFDLTLEGFASEVTDAVDLYVRPPTTGYALSADTVETRVAGAPLRRVGATAALGWRREARRGLYLTGQATATRLLDEAAAPRVAAALPELYAQGRLGARFILFTDLDVDAYVQGRFWTAMRSRAFHAPTGLFALPTAASPATGPTGAVDLYAEAGLRTATLFFAYENALSGTQVQPGAFVVPIYPLAEQRVRFGVFWPIFN